MKSVCLPPGADRLGEKEAAIVQIDFAEPCSDLPRADAARAQGWRIDLTEGCRGIVFLRI